ncbi:MAG TPA: glycosyl hydrolase [Candidatus Dormibacteraeota bacterium]|nr:glycosyl hydrolase [Candidatus Dormibacteraeota bacterium]
MRRLIHRLCANTLALVLGCVAVSALPVAAAAPTLAPQTVMHALSWRNIGPWIGGRVVAVTGVPNDANLFYMGAVDGGIWKSTDYGNRWINISDGTLPGSSNSIGALAVAQSNPSVIYAGTGESDIRGDVITGDGVYKSVNAGKTWTYAGLRETHTISSLVVDPHNPNVVYASSMGHVFKPNAERGVFKSTDGGASWHKVLFVNGETGAIDLVMDPHDPRTLYAAMWQANRTPWKLTSGGPGSGLYKTTDGGAHWKNLTHNPGYSHAILGRIGVSVSASQPNVVYSITQSKDGGVFRSADGGATWTRVNKEWKLRQRAFYYMSIYVDPTNPNTVYVPNVDALWVSHNGGKTFAKLRPPHGDNHIVWINPHDPRILLEGNDGGATVSTDGGTTWSTEHNQPTGQYYHISLDDQFPFHVYGAQQDEGSFEGPSASSDGMIPDGAWHRVAYGESTFVAPEPGNPNVTYGSGYFSIFLRYDMATGQYQSVSPWPNYQEGSASRELKYRFGWTHPIIFSPVDPKRLLIGSQYVLQSDDHGATWKRISPDLTRNDPRTEAPSGGPVDIDQSGAEIYPGIASLAVSPLDGNVLWAGSDDGLIHVTTDGGAHWRATAPPGLPMWSDITSIEPSHTAAGTAYLTASRYMWDDFHPYVYRTTDYGAHWTALTGGLPNDQYAFVVREDPNEPNLLFLGTKNTVYTSFDGGARWQPLSLNLPHVQVRDIAIDTRQGEIAVATHGRAFWILDNLTLLEQLAKQPSLDASTAQLFAPQTAWLTHAYGASEYAKLIPNVGENPPFGATVIFALPKTGAKTPMTLAFTDEKGQLVRRFTLHLGTAKGDVHAGVNRFVWNLRYPDATEVTGFKPPIAAGGLPDTVDGPIVTPGRYAVALTAGGSTITKPFDVALDPRLHATAEDLEARLALQQRIHATLNQLDVTINRAIATRDRLNAAVVSHRVTPAKARPVLAALDTTIHALVQLKIQSSEGSLLHATKLRSHLAYLAADIDLAYLRPTTAQYAVFEDLDHQATVGEASLNAAIARANALL